MRLGTAVPPVGGWRLATLPPTMAPGDIQLMMDRCDRGTEVGVRDFAIILLAARLGLRSIEVARLQLDDIDWRAGELVVRGKAGRQDRMPLPAEVGDALVAYLSDGRNPAGARHLFLTCRAPRGPRDRDRRAGRPLPIHDSMALVLGENYADIKKVKNLLATGWTGELPSLWRCVWTAGAPLLELA